MIKLLFPILLLLIATVPVPAQPPPIEAGVSQELAKWRAAHYSDVRYKLNLTLEKMSPVLKGTMEIRVHVTALPKGVAFGNGLRPGEAPGASMPPIVLDWRKIKGHQDKSTISNVSLNGKPLLSPQTAIADKSVRAPFEEHDEHLIFTDGVVAGENVIKLDLTSPILPSGSAITRYVDKEDGSEYLYSLFVPSDASTAFPVFDQPDLKARFTLTATVPDDNWKMVSNTVGSCFRITDGVEPPQEKPLCPFLETKPISTYVFAFAAGPFERVSVPPALAGGSMPAANQPSVKSETSPPANAGDTDLTNTRKVKLEINEAYKNWANKDVSVPTGGNPSGSEGASQRSGTSQGTLPTGRVSASASEPPGSIYVRKSQAAKFKPHAAEVFRLNREAVKYFEEYFDYKFPFPKYDLVLIPEFPFGGMEHAGATFLREASIIFPQEPTKNDHISRAVLIFHEAAHQWFGDTVTMRWFDDLWLKEGFANFAAYKAMESIMPEANAWKVFYERIKQGAYQTDSTKGTTPIYQEIKNLSAAKSAYGNIVYNKAPAFLRQAEFYLGEDKFQTAVRAFLKKHEFKNAGWEDLVNEFEVANGKETFDTSSLSENQKYVVKAYEEANGTDLSSWAKSWVKEPGVSRIKIGKKYPNDKTQKYDYFSETDNFGQEVCKRMKFRSVVRFVRGTSNLQDISTWCDIDTDSKGNPLFEPVGAIAFDPKRKFGEPLIIFPNYQDYGYGIFLLDHKSRDYVLKNIQNEKDPFLRAMMWGALWDSVREGELDPREYVELVVKVLSPGLSRQPPKGGTQSEDESTVAMLLGRTSTALNYYLPSSSSMGTSPPANAGGTDLRGRVENMLIERMRNAETTGQRITYYRAFLNIASSETALRELRKLLFVQSTVRPPDSGIHRSGIEMIISPSERIPRKLKFGTPAAPFELKTKDKFDIVTRLISSGYVHGIHLLNELEKIETSDEAKRYAYAARAAIPTKENKAKYWNDFVNNKEISESWIEAAFGPWNSIRHSELTLPYLQKALQELPNHKRSRKIFFVNGWLGAFIGGQRSEEALAIVNKFLADNPNLDKDLRLKILENVDVIERAVKIREIYSKGR